MVSLPLERSAGAQPPGGDRLLRPTRRRRTATLLIGGGVVLVLLLLLLRSGEKEEDRPAGPAAASLSVPELRTYTTRDTVHRGDNLRGLLFRNHLDLRAISGVLGSIRANDYFDPHDIRPGQVLEFTRGEAGELLEVVCRIAPERIYVFAFEPGRDSIASFTRAVDSEVRVRKLAGSVLSTFEEALIAAGGVPRLALEVSDIFSGDIDFFTEVRRGDAFSLLVEERYVDGAFSDYGEILYGWYRGEEAEAVCVYYRPAGGKGGHYDLEGGSLKRTFLRSPLNYRRISSTYAKRRFHPILKKYRPHHGVDYAAPTGTPVVSTADGKVTFAGWKGGYGRLVEIRHSPTHSTRYGHLSRLAKGIRTGIRVEQGQKVGYVGATGMATGPHLHYEVRVDDHPIDPLRMKNVPAEPIPSGQLADYQRLAREMVEIDRDLVAGALLGPSTWESILLAQAAPLDSVETVD
ncbi:MAG: peptidoglycan DD-metalloendopeptidase family protein [Candidatus Eisenbacteria bacterium]|nr:peptidoglycan DD-metalloendopeptidase family protein [Candidatus Latescibacterota bacterium]MBD3302214.1 peptidoglycan DD-metalloendopeptidase family protein [Candidatus Eisenbacteria bacterium]